MKPNIEQITLQFDSKLNPLQPANSLSNSFLKSNFFCAGGTEFFPAPEEGEFSQSVVSPKLTL
jgi:hypothetical protein